MNLISLLDSTTLKLEKMILYTAIWISTKFLQCKVIHIIISVLIQGNVNQMKK